MHVLWADDEETMTTPARTALANGTGQEKPRPLTSAERNARWKKKMLDERTALLKAARELLNALATAAEESGCHAWTNHLPDDPAAALTALTERTKNKRLIVAPSRKGETPDAP